MRVLCVIDMKYDGMTVVLLSGWQTAVDEVLISPGSQWPPAPETSAPPPVHFDLKTHIIIIIIIKSVIKYKHDILILSRQIHINLITFMCVRV